MLPLTLSLFDRIVFLVVALLGLAACLGGSRFLRFWLALAGLQAGFYVGLRFSGLILPDPVHQLVLAVVAAIILAGFFAILTRVGSLLAGAGVMLLFADQLLRLLPLPLLKPYGIYILLGFMLPGLMLGVFKVRFFLILASAFNGAWLLSFCTGGFIAAWPLDQAVLKYHQLQGGHHALIMIGTLVFMILGAWLQFALARRARPGEIHAVSQPAAEGSQIASQPDIQPVELVLPERQSVQPPESENKTE